MANTSSYYRGPSDEIKETFNTVYQEILPGLCCWEGATSLFLVLASLGINLAQVSSPYSFSFSALMWVIYGVHLTNILIEAIINPGCVKVITKHAHPIEGSCKHFFVDVSLIFILINIMMVPIVYTSLETHDTVQKHNDFTHATSVIDYLLLSFATAICATYNIGLMQHVADYHKNAKGEIELTNVPDGHDVEKNKKRSDLNTKLIASLPEDVDHVLTAKKAFNLAFSCFFFVYTNWYVLVKGHGFTFITLVTVNSAIINISSEFASRKFRELQGVRDDIGAKNYLVSIFSLVSVLAKIYYARNGDFDTDDDKK